MNNPPNIAAMIGIGSIGSSGSSGGNNTVWNMPLRDFFAAAAMTGMIACPIPRGSVQFFAEESYRQADAMLAERAKEGAE